MEFEKWRSIPRLSKERMTLTEKIDGSNACIIFKRWPDDSENVMDTFVGEDGELWNMWTQSRTRFISPENDNFGFAQWAWQNRVKLLSILGEGKHYGEWWGHKIQNGYGLAERRFSLFNAQRWHETITVKPGSTEVYELCTVPILYAGEFDGDMINRHTDLLRITGSKAVEHTWKAEGLIVDLREANARYKVLLEGNQFHKWELTQMR